MLIASAVEPCSPCAVTVFERTAGGHEQVRWRSDGVERDPHGNFVITFPAGFLTGSEYVVRISGQRDGATVQLAEFRVVTR
jgi:hypothetical protein